MPDLLKYAYRITGGILTWLLLWSPGADVAMAQIRWARLLNATQDPVNWLLFGHDYTGHRFAPLDQINRDTVRKLVLKWTYQFGTSESVERAACSPLAVYGTLYGTGAQNMVYAIDARTGDSKWRRQFAAAEELRGEEKITNYGLAIHENHLYWISTDARLYCLDTGSGDVVWSLKIADHKAGYRGIGAPLPLKEHIITGIAVNNANVRGFLDAYAPGQGKRLWRRYTIPVPGEPGADTWGADSWLQGGGETWMTGCYDPELNLLYWSVGAPEPRYSGEQRPGDNLYTNSILAINPDTGDRLWHYQIIPHNIWGFNDALDMLLVDIEWQGEQRQALVMATAGGYVILLDRKSGRFLSAAPFVKQLNWVAGMDENGRIIPPAAGGGDMIEFSPAATGGRQNTPIAYSRRTKAVYLYRREGASSINPQGVTYRQGRPFSVAELASDTTYQESSALIAFDFLTGKTLWEYPVAVPMTAGILATEGGLIFAGDAAGYFYAFDERTGELLWKYQTGAPVGGSPIAYRVDQKQRISVVAGNGAVYTFGLFEPLEGDDVKTGFH